MEKAFFFDRDGILNEDRGDYSYLIDHFKVVPATVELMRRLKT